MSKTNENVIEHVSQKAEEIKNHVNGAVERIEAAVSKADKPTDRVLAFVEKSGLSVVIVGAYSVAMVVLGAYLF